MEALRDKMIKKMEEMNLNKTEAAKIIGYDRSTFSKYLSETYTGNVADIEKKIKEFLDENDNIKPSILPKKQECFESRDYTSVLALCQSCQEDMGIGIVVGKSGRGKTHALKQYARLPRVAYIECDGTMACRDLVKALENALGMPLSSYGTIWERVSRIREFLNMNTGYLIIVDEADKLASKYTNKKMEILREICDKADVGLVIAGEPALETTIRLYLERFANRVDFYYKLMGLSASEVKRYLKEFSVDDAAVNELIYRATNEKNGCFRLLDRTMNNVIRVLKSKGETDITMGVVKEASSMMMM